MGILRDNMIMEMRLRNYSNSTINLYTKAVHDLAYFYRRSPLCLSLEEVKRYFYSLILNKTSSARLHISYSGLKFFYLINGRPHFLDQLPRPKREFKLPAVLSQSEVETIIACSRTLRYKAFFSLVYSAGLRLSEALSVMLADVDFERKVILVRNGKGMMDRYVILSDKLSKLLMRYMHRYRPDGLLFSSIRDKGKKMAKRFIQSVFQRQVRDAHIAKRVRIHTLRHSFATHLLENNTNLFHIMKLLGHRSIKSTIVYLHLQRLDSLDLKSPLDIFDISLEKHVGECRVQYELAIA